MVFKNNFPRAEIQYVGAEIQYGNFCTIAFETNINTSKTGCNFKYFGKSMPPFSNVKYAKGKDDYKFYCSSFYQNQTWLQLNYYGQGVRHKHSREKQKMLKQSKSMKSSVVFHHK